MTRGYGGHKTVAGDVRGRGDVRRVTSVLQNIKIKAQRHEKHPLLHGVLSLLLLFWRISGLDKKKKTM